MLRSIIWPYKMGSSAAKSLAAALNTKRVRSVGRYRPRPQDLIINYGNSHRAAFVTDITFGQILNNPTNVAIASNKLVFFQVVSAAKEEHSEEYNQLLIPEWTTDYEKAVEWSASSAIVNRTILNGSSGVGIYITDKKQAPLMSVDDKPVKLWVKYIPKRREYRVHVFDNTVIDVQQKRKKKDEEVESRVRNHDNGWVFTRQNVEEVDGLHAAAKLAVQSIGLDFGAVDIVWNQKRNQCYVLEVNTAPGLEGQTVESYKNAFQKYCQENQ